MNIEKIEKGFSNLIRIGIYSIIIHLDKLGVYVSLDDIYEQCTHFNNVIITGKDVLSQKEEIVKLFKKLVKNNTSIRLELHTDSIYKPLEINAYKDNIVFYVYIPLRNVGLTWEQRLNETNVGWYGELNSSFLFKVKDLEDLDDVLSLTSALGIKKSKVFILPLDNYDTLKEHIKFYSFNIASEVDW